MSAIQDVTEEKERAAVEVVTVFADTIVDTRHLTDPSPPRVRGSTVALIAIGAAALGVAFLLFLISCVSAFAAGRGGDVAVAALLGGGMTSLVAGLLRRAAERAPRDFTVGVAASATQPLAAALPLPAFPLVRATGDGWQLCFAASMAGEVAVGADERPLADLVGAAQAAPHVGPGVFAVPLGEGARARVAVDTTTFFVRAVRAPRRQPVPIRVDAPAVAWMGAVGAAFTVGLLLIFSLPPDAHALSFDPHASIYHLGTFNVKPPQVDPIADLRNAPKKTGDSGGRGRAAAGPSGRMGARDSTKKDGHFTLKGPPHNVDQHMARQIAAEQASNAGVLGFLRAQNGSPFASVMSRDVSPLGHDADTVMGTLIGTQVGGGWGDPTARGLVGGGHGGGGTGVDTIGLGNIGGGIDRGGGGGLHGGWGSGHTVGWAPHKAEAPDGPRPVVTVTENYPKYMVRQVVHQHLPEVKYCYEKELSKSPDLYGRVVIQFTIAGMGQVATSAVQQSSLRNGSVEQCIAGAVRRWTFPKPNNGIVMVSYPFTLKASGAGEQ